MGDDKGFIFLAFLWISTIAVFFAFGHMFGREYQCNSMGMEYYKGKCVVVTRTERDTK